MVAVIPAAGLGTRFLPVTRVVPKEMLPIGSRPALELLVEEARAAGAERIVIIVSDAKELIRKYFADSPDIVFARQEEQRGLGHALLQAAEAAGGTAAGRLLVLLGDAVVLGGNAAAELVRMSAANGGGSVIGCERVPRERVSRYGIMRLEGERIVELVEKPAVEEAPSNLAIAGRYLLNARVFEYLASQTPGCGGEIQLTDALRRMLRAGLPFYACEYSGKRHDIGNPEGYFSALQSLYERKNV